MLRRSRCVQNFQDICDRKSAALQINVEKNQSCSRRGIACNGGGGVFTLTDLASTMWVCVLCVFSSHPFWTSSSLDVPAGVTQEEGHTGFLIHLPSAVRALIFVARRIQPFLSLVDREVDFFVLTN